MKQKRKIKVSAKRNFCKRNNIYGGQFPKIILSGEWLEKAGFKVGQVIYVNVDMEKLTLSVA